MDVLTSLFPPQLPQEVVDMSEILTTNETLNENSPSPWPVSSGYDKMEVPSSLPIDMQTPSNTGRLQSPSLPSRGVASSYTSGQMPPPTFKQSKLGIGTYIHT